MACVTGESSDSSGVSN